MSTYKYNLFISRNFYDRITTQIIVNILYYTYKYKCKYPYFKNVFCIIFIILNNANKCIWKLF